MKSVRKVLIILAVGLVYLLFGGVVNTVSAGPLVFDPDGVSHLYWPFANTTNSNRKEPGGLEWHVAQGSSLHTGGDQYAQDWNLGGGSSDFGRPFYAPFSGTVIYSDNQGVGFGNTVIILSDNGSFALRVSHLENRSVDDNAVVNGGSTQLGTIGNSGTSDVHAHVALYRNVNTTSLLSALNAGSVPPAGNAALFDFDGPNPVLSLSLYTTHTRTLGAPFSWYYKFEHSDSRVKEVYLNTDLILTELQTCKRLYVGTGVHTITVRYEANGNPPPAITATGYPFLNTDCPTSNGNAPSMHGIQLLLPPNHTVLQNISVQNNTSTSWNNTYKLVFQGGTNMGTPPQLYLSGTTAPGQFTGISMTLTSPAVSGNHRSYWRVFDGNGNPVSQMILVDIEVQNNASPVGVGTGQVKLFTGTNYSGTATSYGQGGTNAPNATAYSLQMPSGWSVRTYRTDNYSGIGTDTRCWSESVPNLQDHDNWQGAIQSMKVFNYNDCAGGQKVKLYSGTNYQNEILSTDVFTNAPSKNSYSIQIPSGWSVRAFTSDNYGGGDVCWSSSVANLQDTGWHNAIDSMQIFYTNVCPSNSDHVVVCVDTGFSNCAWTLPIKHNLPSLSAGGYGNDIIGSIDVTGSWRAIVYHGENYEGARAVLNSSINDMGGTPVGNDQASSIQVRRVEPTRIILYDLGDLNGTGFISDRTVPDLAHWGFNDMAESVRVDPGYEVILCENVNFRGICGRTNTNQNNLDSVASGLQHNVSSFQVCEGSCPPSAMVPVQATPVDTASFLPGSDVVFSWVGNGDEYYIEYWGGDLNGVHNSNGIYGTTTWTATGLPGSANPYYWRMHSWTQYGQTAWSPTYSFKIQDIAPKDVIIAGPSEVESGVNQQFNTFINPVDAGNLTLVWSPEPVSGQGTLTPTYNFVKPGTKTITLTATNTGGTMSGSYTFDVKCPVDEFMMEYFGNSSLSGVAEFKECVEDVDYDWGTSGPKNGADGDLNVPVNETVYTDWIKSKVTENADSDQDQITLLSAAGFEVSDEVLVIQMVGTGAGNYEFKRIVDKSGNVLTLDSDFANDYSVTGGNRVQIVRVPHYKNVEVYGKLTAHAWDGSTGGISAFRVAGTLDVKTGGTVSVVGLGYLGGAGGNYPNYYPDTGDTGASYAIAVTLQGHNGGDCGGCVSPLGTPNSGAGTGGRGARGGDSASGGGGGSYGTPGSVGSPVNIWPWQEGGDTGATYGDSTLTKLFLGSGGGGGGKGKDGYGATGGNGGGILWIDAGDVILNGTLNATGSSALQNASENGGGGGGGSGGSLYLNAYSVQSGTNSFVNNGGTRSFGVVSGNGSGGGNGGLGRMYVKYCESFTGSSDWLTPVQVSCNGGKDNFSVRWTGDIDFEEAGEYEFTTWTDDGTRVWVDDELLIDNWEDQNGETPFSESVELIAGIHQVKMEYYEGTGNAKAKLIITEDEPEDSCPEGFDAEYFNNTDLSGTPVLTRCEDKVNYFWWDGSSPESGTVNNNNFSARWQGEFTFAAGTYTFASDSDDGIKVWVDNVLKIDNWTAHSPISYDTVDVVLTAGVHTVKVEYYELTGNARAVVSWMLPQTQSSNCVVEGSFCAKYFNNTSLTGDPVLSLLESEIDHAWGTTSPSSAVNSDNYSVRWEGQFQFNSDEYTFTTGSDAGVRLWLDGNLIIDNWTAHSYQEDGDSVNVSAGLHTVKVEYYETTGDANLWVYWYQ